MTSEEVIARGKELYENGIRAQVEGEHFGKMLAVNVYTGDYFITDTDAEFVERIRPVYGHGRHYLLRIGEKPLVLRRRGVRRILWNTARPCLPDDSEATKKDDSK